MLPTPGTFVELTGGEEPLGGVRVISLSPNAPAGSIELSMAPGNTPEAGTTVTLRWPAGVRGRYALMVTVNEVQESRVQTTPTGPSEIEQQRHFVRGGGGEELLLLRPGQPDTLGSIRDISERGVRAHFTDVELTAGEEVRLRFRLESETAEVAATTTRVASLRQSLPQQGPVSVEVVAAMTPDEHQAQMIRRYIFRQQLLDRTR